MVKVKTATNANNGDNECVEWTDCPTPKEVNKKSGGAAEERERERERERGRRRWCRCTDET